MPTEVFFSFPQLAVNFLLVVFARYLCARKEFLSSPQLDLFRER